MRNSEYEKEKNHIKEVIKGGNEIGEMNEIEKEMLELNLKKKTEDDENDEGGMSNLKDSHNEKDK